jgi:hypothetical protein
VDPLANAYATLGLRRGCTPSDVKKTYRKLVKRWHPDRHAADAAGQAEAELRMRDINRAFRLVADDIAGPRRGSTPVTPPTRGPAAEAVPRRAVDPERPFSRREIEEMVAALGNVSPVDVVFEWIDLAGPFVAAFVLLVFWPWSRTFAALQAAAGVLVLGFAVVRSRRRLR